MDTNAAVMQGFANGVVNLLKSVNQIDLYEDVYQTLQLSQTVYAQMTATPPAPEAPSGVLGLTCGQIYNAIQSYNALQTFLNENSAEDLKNLCGILGASNGGL